MLKFAVASALIFCSTTAFAASQEIAYVKVGGKSQEVYLIHSNGTGAIKVYTAAAKKSIAALDFKPSGEEIAIVELGSPLRIVGLSDNGTPTAPREITTPCQVHAVDYHPTESRLLLAVGCHGSSHVATMDANGENYKIVASGIYLNAPRWLSDGQSFAYLRAVEETTSFELRVSRSSVESVVAVVNAGSWMDVSYQGNVALVTDNNSNVEKFNLDDASQPRETVVRGTDAHFAADGSRFIYETPHAAKGNHLYIYRPDGAPWALTTKGDYGPRDWRK
jgi:hypothetical protein